MDCELFKKKSSWDNNIKTFYAPHEDLCGTRSIVWVAEKEILISSENCGKIIEWDFKTGTRITENDFKIFISPIFLRNFNGK